MHYARTGRSLRYLECNFLVSGSTRTRYTHGAYKSGRSTHAKGYRLCSNSKRSI